jgi:predicted transport protein
MNLYQLKGSKIDFVGLNPFKVEKEIQDIVEKNTQEFFSLEFVRSEFSVGGFRIDTLCYNNETSSFVIIEYKRSNSYSVIDQGYSYLSLMLNNKPEFIIEYNERLNKNLRRDDIDWTQSRIIFISQSFSSYQKNSINFKNLPFELWEIKRFKNDTIVLNQQISNSKEGIDTLVSIDTNSEIDEVNKEIQVVDEEYHTSKLDVETKEKWEQLKERICELDGVSTQLKKPYISFMGETKNVCYCVFRKNYISVELVRGNINPDGSKSKNFFTLDDPKGFSEEGSWEWKSGVKGNIYRIRYNKNTDLDYIMFLINQKYKSL